MRKVVLLLVLGVLFWCNPGEARVRHRRRRHRVLTMTATAYARAPQKTASGTRAREGMVAADPAVLPMGTRIRILGSDGYDGNYLVTDQGPAIKGRHIDVYLASLSEAKQFGTKTVRVVIEEMGQGKEDAREKVEARLARRSH